MEFENKDDIIARLEEEIHTLKTIIAESPGNIFLKDTQGRYVIYNKNVAKLANQSLFNKTDIELFGQEVGEQLQKIDKAITDSGKEKYLEETGFDENRKPATYLSMKRPFYNSKGKIAGVLGISMDISDRKQFEIKLKNAKQNAEKANRAKSRFLAMVSHELRTPLTSILGFANLLREKKLSSKKRREYQEHIINSGTYLLSLINNILDYSRLETHKFELTNIPFNLKKLMKETISMLKGTADLKKISVSLHYDANTPKEIIADPRVMKQIMVNLIANAIKFTKKGSVKIEVSLVKSLAAHAAQLKISVADTGIGIPTEEQKNIFNKFYQSGNIYTRDTNVTGTGLGLAIVKKLLRLLNSKIQLKSEENVGSVFYFSSTFLIPEKQSNASMQKNKLPSHLKNDKTKKTDTYVLLIEDNPLIQIVHKTMLEDLGCRVDVAGSAIEALEMIKNKYDILFVDIGLPDTDGFELIKIIKKRNVIKKKVPIIALTGYSEVEEHQKCLNAGANEVVIKPASNETLKKILHDYTV